MSKSVCYICAGDISGVEGFQRSVCVSFSINKPELVYRLHVVFYGTNSKMF